MSIQGFTGNNVAGTSDLNRAEIDEECTHCGVRLRARQTFVTETRRHLEVHCASCGRDGCLSESLVGGVPSRRGQVFGARWR
jgi:hypothetical protein